MSQELDFETKQATGDVKNWTLVFRDDTGRSILLSHKKLTTRQFQEYTSYLDKKINLRLQNVTFSTYLSNNRAALHLLKLRRRKQRLQRNKYDSKRLDHQLLKLFILWQKYLQGEQNRKQFLKKQSDKSTYTCFWSMWWELWKVYLL